MNRPIVFVAPNFSLADANSFTSGLRDDHNGFSRLAARLEKLCGIHLPSSDKNYSLMAGRLGPLLRDYNFAGYEEYDAALAVGTSEMNHEFVSALTTNTTEFFREAAHFDYLAKLASTSLRRASEIRIWCAACSSGQEVWTILMTFFEAFGGQPPAIKMLASDIDQEVLARAAAGKFTESEIKTVPPLFRQRYFVQTGGEGRKVWQVSPTLLRLVTFAPFNLTQAAYPFRHPFDVVFCRNVLIYFDKPIVQQVLKHLSQSLKDGGHLFLGHSESGTLRNDAMTSVAAAVYQRKE